MMIHDKIVSGQFLLDLKNDRPSLLQAAAVAQHNHPQVFHHLQPPSPPMAALDIYSAYAYSQQLQQQLLNSAVPQHMSAADHSSQLAEVLDLSRRDLVELPPKTPSPYQTNSSLCSRSPAASPNDLLTIQQQQPRAPLMSSKFLFAGQAKQQTLNNNSLNMPAKLAALYPTFYYQNSAFKQESMSTTTPTPTPPPPPVTVATNCTNSTAKANNSLLQTFASAAAAAAVNSLQLDNPEPNATNQLAQQPSQPSIATSTHSSNSNSLAALDSKNTRPFKAFPRDPLVIAANFAATDVLLDNPRVERYTEYRKRVLEQIRSSNGGSRTVSNPKMRRTNSSSGSIHEGSSSNTSENDERHHEESSDSESNSGNDHQATTTNIKNPVCSSTTSSTTDTTTSTSTTSNGIVKDAAYYERRRKNNAAAKKSRDRRRIKEDEIAIRAAYLERQNIELLCQIDALKAQLAALTSKMA